MSSPDRRAARAALDAARSTVARLHVSRGPEELAADLVETGSAVETALRSLLGGSPLEGQSLIRAARERQLIAFSDANALAEFDAVRQRLARPTYVPTETDVAAARGAFNALDASLSAGADATQAMAAPPAAIAPLPDGAPTAPAAARRRFGRYPVWIVAAASVAVLVLVLGFAWFLARDTTDPALARGIELYQRGQREAAVGEFNRAIRANPRSAMPRIYLARLAREAGSLMEANDQLQRALEVEPDNPVALREMGALMLTNDNYDLARRFYTRALEVDPRDQLSQGYLGCSLAGLGRQQEAATWLSRAGPGPWVQCAERAAAGAPR